MSLIKINDELDITITNDDELEKAMNLFSGYKKVILDHDIDEEIHLENEIKLLNLENAMKLYKGDYFIIE